MSKNWVEIIHPVKATKLCVLVVRNDNASRALYDYFYQHFRGLTSNNLHTHKHWEDVKLYNWEYHSIAHDSYKQKMEHNKRRGVGGNKSLQQLELEFLESIGTC